MHTPSIYITYVIYNEVERTVLMLSTAQQSTKYKVHFNFVDLHVMFFMAVRLNYINGIKRVQKTGITAS